MTFITFLVAAVVLAITPGPGIAYVMARTVAGGRGVGLASCLGTGLGGLVHVAAAAFGLSALIARYAFAYDLIKWLGAAYLVYLGIRMLLRKDQSGAAQQLPVASSRRAFAEGILVETLNVKTALFFLAFLPQFTTADMALVPQILMLGSICVGLNTLVDVLVVLATNALLKSSPARQRRSRLLTRASGVTLIALGGILALSHRSA